MSRNLWFRRKINPRPCAKSPRDGNAQTFIWERLKFLFLHQQRCLGQTVKKWQNNEEKILILGAVTIPWGTYPELFY